METSQTFISVKDEATVDAHECVLYAPGSYVPRTYVMGDMHTGVGFCVARSTEMGNAKASECGTGDGKDSHAFFVYDEKLMLYKTFPTWESFRVHTSSI